MVTKFSRSRSSLVAERLYSDGNEPAENISSVLGGFQVGSGR